MAEYFTKSITAKYYIGDSVIPTVSFVNCGTKPKTLFFGCSVYIPSGSKNLAVKTGTVGAGESVTVSFDSFKFQYGDGGYKFIFGVYTTQNTDETLTGQVAYGETNQMTVVTEPPCGKITNIVLS